MRINRKVVSLKIQSMRAVGNFPTVTTKILNYIKNKSLSELLKFLLASSVCNRGHRKLCRCRGRCSALCTQVAKMDFPARRGVAMTPGP